MPVARLNDLNVHYRIDGPPGGPPVVFANSLGTDMRVWDAVLPHLPPTLRILRYDMRGHGLSDAPDAPYHMGALIHDAECLIEHLDLRDVVFVGLSIGGMIAQGLAAKRPDLLRAMVLSNTAARIGTREIWNDRIAEVNAGGIGALADAVMERWFTPGFRATPDVTAWRNMLTRTPAQGYTGCCAAISGSDFHSTTAMLTLPTLAIAGSGDGSTPPDLVRETAGLIDGSRFALIRDAGHLPCVEQPGAFAHLLTTFLADIGHAGAPRHG